MSARSERDVARCTSLSFTCFHGSLPLVVWGRWSVFALTSAIQPARDHLKFRQICVSNIEQKEDTCHMRRVFCKFSDCLIALFSKSSPDGREVAMSMANQERNGRSNRSAV